MPVITAIKAQKREGRYNVFLDGEFAFGVDAETLLKEKLAVGRELSEEKVGRLRDRVEFNKLFEKALNFLSYRPRSEREIRDYLRRKRGQNSEVRIQDGKVVEKLKKLGYIDDLAFAKWWVEQRRQSSKPRGARLIRSELFQKGIAREIINEVLESVGDEDGESSSDFDLALKAAEKKLSSYQNLEPQEFKRKMGAYLARRGFEWEVVREVVSQLTPKV